MANAAPGREPLLRGERSQAGQDAKQKKTKAKEATSKPMQHWQTTLLVFASLMTMEFIAATAYCMDLTWIMYMRSCSRHNPVTVDRDGFNICVGNCSPMTLDVIWDMSFTNVFLTVFWYFGNQWLDRFGKETGAEMAEGNGWQKQQNEDAVATGYPGRSKDPAHHEPRHSWEWSEELKGWQERKAVMAEIIKSGRRSRAYMFYFMYFVIGTIDMYAVLLISPANWTTQIGGTLPYIMNELKGTVDPRVSGGYSLIVVIQFVLEVGLFAAAALTVRWPRPALIRKGSLTYRPKMGRYKQATQVEELLVDEHPGLVKETCLMIACHKSCLTRDRMTTFRRTVQNAMRVFPASAIFVCDNGPTPHPVDRTQEVCRELSRETYPDGSQEVQYLYVPEGNKSHAMYWTTEYWIPELVRRGECIDFKYAIVLDDDVPLPPDFHVPVQTLNRNPDIKAISYVIGAATESGKENQLVALQDLEYKLAGFVKQFQWQYGTTLACHGAIGLWRRDILGTRILYEHDTAFHGEDMYMGLLLHRMQKNYAIMVSAGAVVPTYAPEKLLVLFRQRVRSWDLCAQRKFTTQVREFLRGWFHSRTLILKPFILQEIINVLLDWIRFYAIAGLAQRNPVGLLILFVIFYLLLYAEIFAFNYMVLAQRQDLRLSLRTVLLFPFYRTLCLLFRLYALMWNVVHYSSWTRKSVKISEREEFVQDLPPVPRVANPNWMTVFRSNTAEAGSDSTLQSFVADLMRPLQISQPVELRRIRSVVQAHLLYKKLLVEDAHAEFPTAMIGFRRTTEEEVTLLQNAMEALRVRFEVRLQELIGPQWQTFSVRLQKVVNQWMELESHALFYTQLLQQQRKNRRKTDVDFVLRSNQRILEAIREMVYDTRYPAQRDRVRDIKDSLNSVLDLIEMKLHGGAQERSHQQAMTTITKDMKRVKHVLQEQNLDQLEEVKKMTRSIRMRIQQTRLDDKTRGKLLKMLDAYDNKVKQLERGDQPPSEPAT